MTPDQIPAVSEESPACPACGKPPEGGSPSGPRGGIHGGIPTTAAMESTAVAGPAPAGTLDHLDGPLLCKSCGEALYQVKGALLPHRGTPPMLPMHVAAARLRNHLRRLAITRVDLIDGDCYLLPYYRVEGEGPDGESSWTVLANRVGDSRLERPVLPPADLRAYREPEAGDAGAAGEGHAALRVLPATISWKEAAARAGGEAWKARRAVELIHYPFWLMRVGDTGKIEGAWMDGIEARLILHRIRLAPTVPSRRARAGWLAIPAVAAAAGALAEPSLALPIAGAAWLLSMPLMKSVFLGKWNG